MSLIYPKSIFIVMPNGRIINTSSIRTISSAKGTLGEKTYYLTFNSPEHTFLPLTEEEYNLIRNEFLNLSITTEVNENG